MSLHFTSCRGLPRLMILGAVAMATVPTLSRYARGDMTQPAAAPFAGTFRDDKISVELAETGGIYVGAIIQGPQRFPAKAAGAGQQLQGTFAAAGAEFPFTATIVEGRLILVSGGTTHSLARVVSNPLASAAPASPTSAAPTVPAEAPHEAAAPDAAAHAGGAFDESASFSGFSVLGATPAGKTLFIQLPTAKTLESAITQAADQLGKTFDAKPILSNAFADAKARNRGGVSLTAKLKGQDIRGVIFCGADQTGGSATVIVAKPDASKEEMAKLLNFMPAPLSMHTHTFPDGSGSIDFPEGWTTNFPSARHGIVATGPAGQAISFSLIRSVYYPECNLVRMKRQTYQMQLQNYQMQLRQHEQMVLMHQRNPNILAPMAPPKPPVAPDPDPNVNSPYIDYCQYCDGPEEALKNFWPIMEQKGKRAGGPWTSLDKIIAIYPTDPSPLMPKSKSGTAYFAVTDHVGEEVKHMRVLSWITTAPIMEGEVWQLSISAMRAPDATFDRDLPVMTAIMNSIKLDMNMINDANNAEGAAIRKQSDDRFQALLQRGRDFQDSQARSFAQHQSQIAAQEKARHDSASDFIEYIGGVRHVYDTQTGRTLNVDLFNSNGIVNGLNEGANDPNRFVQIPLRYER